MKKILYTLISLIGMYEYGDAMQKGVATQIYVEETNSPFAFIGKSLVLKDINSSFSASSDSIWNKITQNEEEIDTFLKPDDLNEADIEKLELSIPKTDEKLERAFFGNNILSDEFFKIKVILITGNELPCPEINKVNWLIQNFRGDYECAKVLATFYRFKKNKIMYSFWRHVALFFHLAVGDL